MHIPTLFTITEIWKQPNYLLMNEKIKIKLWHVSIKGYNSAIKKMGSLPFTTARMKPEDIMLNEISQTQKTNTV